MNSASIIFNRLIKHKVTDVFLYSGGAIMPLIDKFYKSSIKYYINAHEQNCGHSATGYAKSSNKTGISIVTSGPGITNSVTPLLDAKNDSIPLIVISANVSESAMGTNAFQEAPAVQITHPVTKWSYCVSSKDNIQDIIDSAFYVANNGKKGSVHIDIPKCVLIKEVTKREYNRSLVDPINRESYYKIDAEKINKIAEIITCASKPVLYVGHGGFSINCDTYRYIRQLSINYNIPVTTTMHGMGVFPETHTNSINMCGMHGLAAANFALQEADCIIAIGSRFDDRTTGNVSKYAPNCKNFIHFNINRNDINTVIKTDHYIIGDIKITLPILIKEIRKKPFNKYKTNWLNQINTWKKKYPFRFDKSPYNKIKTQDVIVELNKQISDNIEKYIITTGVGNHQMMACQFIDWQYPKRFISSGSLGVMGTGLPYAIGCKIANPTLDVINIDGDSSFMMTMGDLKTIAEYNIPIKIIILNNNSQDMVRVWETLFFNGRITATENKANPSFVEMVKSFNIHGLYCDNSKDLPDMIAELLHYNKPVLLECKVDKDMCLPLVPPGAGLDEMILHKSDAIIDKSDSF